MMLPSESYNAPEPSKTSMMVLPSSFLVGGSEDVALVVALIEIPSGGSSIFVTFFILLGVCLPNYDDLGHETHPRPSIDIIP